MGAPATAVFKATGTSNNARAGLALQAAPSPGRGRARAVIATLLAPVFPLPVEIPTARSSSCSDRDRRGLLTAWPVSAAVKVEPASRSEVRDERSA
jgi:hypothetical protein